MMSFLADHCLIGWLAEVDATFQSTYVIHS